MWIPPGVTLVGLILGLYLLGEGLRDQIARR
jgi:ABC-type dipeptide/oligopeptide/nickel transport system permease subunit